MDILKIPFVYRLLQNVIGGSDSKRIEKEYLIHNRGINVLDVGCGTADLIDGFFEDTNYYGVDIENKYVEANKKKYSKFDNLNFYNFDINDPAVLSELGQRKYDIIMMIGVLHHMNDEACKRCLNSIRKLMTEESRFVSIDPLRWGDQPLLSRMLVDMDRGKYVRTEEGYRGIVEPIIPRAEFEIRGDLYRFPYRHIIFC